MKNEKSVLFLFLISAVLPLSARAQQSTPTFSLNTLTGELTVANPSTASGDRIGIDTPLGFKSAIHSETYGQGNTAAGRATVVNTDVQDAQVLGVPGTEFASFYTDRDSVADFLSNTLPSIRLTLAGSSYSATRLIPNSALTAAQLALLQVGMYIDTLYDPLGSSTSKYTGKITGWAADGSYINVSGWTKFGNNSPGQVPPSGSANDTAIINPITKIWAVNGTCTINPNSYGRKCALAEWDMYNNVADSDPADSVNTPTTWGMDVVSLSKRGGIGYVLRGPWHTGFWCQSGSAQYACNRVDGAPNFGFFSSQVGGIPFSYNPAGNGPRWQVNADGSMEVGDQTPSNTAGNTYIDMHSTGTANDYDVRMIAEGGNGNSGQGKLTIDASSLQVPTVIGAGRVNTNVINLAASTPSSSTDACFQGDIRADSGFIYVCVSNNLWRKAALQPF